MGKARRFVYLSALSVAGFVTPVFGAQIMQQQEPTPVMDRAANPAADKVTSDDSALSNDNDDGFPRYGEEAAHYPSKDGSDFSDTSRFKTYRVAPPDEPVATPVSPFDSSGFGLAYKPPVLPDADLSLGRQNPNPAGDPSADTNGLRLDKTTVDDLQVGVEYHLPY